MFKQYDHNDQLPLSQEKRTPPTAWLSCVFDLLIPLNIVYSFYLIMIIYFTVFETYFLLPSRCNLVTPCNALAYHTLLLSYTGLLILTCYAIRKDCLTLTRILITFHIYWNFLIRPILSYIKRTFFLVNKSWSTFL